MKRITNPDEPQELKMFRVKNSSVTWEEVRNDGEGRCVYEIIRRTLYDAQCGLCAFCEIDIHASDPLKFRVEHFHPKADISTAHNWALDWENMLAVCMGGSQRHQSEPYTLEPLNRNLSCDAHKDRMIQSGHLQEQCEGWIINPKDMPAFPRLLLLERSTGRLVPDDEKCSGFEFECNHHLCTQSLVQHTIDMLNLNCSRLCKARQLVAWDIERNKKRMRQQGVSPQQGLQKLAKRYLRQEWPRFFTTIRFCLGTAAEQHLNVTRFQG